MTPFAKISDKAIASVAERATTVRRELQRSIEVGEVKRRVREAYADVMKIAFRDDTFSGHELDRIHALEQEKYASPSWIDQTPLTPDLAGTFQTKTDAGLLSVSLTLAGTSIKSIYISGDFFVGEEALATMERELRWSSANRETVAGTLGKLQSEGVSLPGIPLDVLVEAIARARDAAAEPSLPVGRGCFVAPERTV